MRKLLILFTSFISIAFLATKIIHAESCPQPPCYTKAECSLTDCYSCAMCQPASGNCPSECRSGQLDCNFSLCRDNCSFCQFTPTEAEQEEPKESIEGKIINPALPFNLSTTPGSSFLGKFLRMAVKLVLILGTIIFFFVFVSGGIRWLSSSGDKAKLESAQKQISSGLTGLAILLSAFAIIQLIETLFGISLLKITLPVL